MVSVPGQTPEVSIVICHHTGDLIMRCLESIQNSAVSNAEVIIISSNPPPPHVWASRFDPERFWFRCLLEQGGPAHKRNVGTAVASSDIVVYLDDDVELDKNCLASLKAFLDSNPRCGMVFSKILNMERRNIFDDCGSWLTWTGFLWARAQNNQRDLGQYDVPCSILSSKSATCAIRRKVFYDVGRFDPDYGILGEETDLAWRVWLSGHQVWYTPDAVSYHAFGCESLKPSADYYTVNRIHYNGCRNYLSCLTTNLGLLRLCRTLPVHMLAWIVAAFGFWSKGHKDRAKAIMAGLKDYFSSWEKLMKKRDLVQSTRKISDWCLLRQAGFQPPFRYYADRLRTYLVRGLHG